MDSIVLRGTLIRDEPLARYTSWHVGGPADQTYRPADLNDLVNFLQTLAKDEPVTWLGLGSNVLIRDGGIRGTVIITQNRLNGLAQQPTHIRVEAGVPCAKMAKYCTNLGFVEAAFFAGVPGTMGGALAMNAGAFGGETWRYVKAVETINHAGEIQIRSPIDFKVNYREVIRPDNEWIIAGHFTFREGNPTEAKQAIHNLLQKRSQTQPIGVFSGGSTFRNPPDNYAAKLIEACGLKGLRQGGAVVSEKHANFIINEGNASAADIENLIYLVQAKVEQMRGIKLIPEVHILGIKKP